MVRVAVFASGNGGNFQSIVETSRNYEEKNYEIELLIVDKESAFAIERAKKLGVPYYVVLPKSFSSKKEYEERIIEILKENKIDLVALAGYMRIISPTLLNEYRDRIVNIHPAYLPNFPGKDGIGDAFRAGAKETGVTIHYVDEGVDSGKIIYQEKLTIEKDWDIEKLEEEIHKIEHRIYPKTLKELCKNF
ncbi:phosphoribosylglycinamide formyltransferase [Fusobacterium sp.]|uniref:phosphoribosylglycinamide formyltransferase n=1 Tax=Fusobacterium sp. TaxID=68766 RepID=UPI00261F85F9|nr:phosphoribosylglycinamide formyltransferase [Fusobacterium sp.]